MRSVLRTSPLCFVAMVVLAAPVRGSEPPAEEPVHLRIGYSARTFFDVGITDARAATRVSADALIRRAGLLGTSEVVIPEDLDALEETAKLGQIDILTLTISEYVQMADKIPLTPALTAVRGEDYREHYVLIAHRDHGAAELQDFRGTRLMTAADLGGSVPIVWLNALLLRNGLPRSNHFFGQVTSARKTIRAVLPVFFRQADLCLVPRTILETVSELNPQIGRELRLVAVSPGFSYGVVCFSDGLPRELRDTIREALLNMHVNPEGQQLLTLFYVDQLIPYEPSHLKSVLDLFEEYERLRKEPAGGGAE